MKFIIIYINYILYTKKSWQASEMSGDEKKHTRCMGVLSDLTQCTNNSVTPSVKSLYHDNRYFRCLRCYDAKITTFTNKNGTPFSVPYDILKNPNKKPRMCPF